MNNKTNASRFVAVPCAIVDETHFCLLPPTADRTVEGDYGPSSLDGVYVAPAIPLSLIGTICGQEYISRCNVHRNSDEAIVTEIDNVGEADYSIIETRSIQASDITQQYYRFIQPTVLSEGDSPLLPLRVSSSHCIDEGEILHSIPSRNGEPSAVDVILPQYSDDSIDLDSIDEYGGIGFYGGQTCNNFEQERESIEPSSTVSSKHPHNFEVIGTGSCIMGNFLGAGMFEQALILPRVDMSMLSSVWLIEESEETVEHRKKLLYAIITNAIVTDGSGILLSRRLRYSSLLKCIDGVVNLELQPLQERKLANETPDQEQAKMEIDHDTKRTQKEDLLSQLSHHSTQQIERIQGKNVDSALDNDIANKSIPPWLEAMEATINRRIAEETACSHQLEKTAEVREDLVRQGVTTVHQATRCEINNILEGDFPKCMTHSRDPEIIRFRYGTRPRQSMSLDGGMSAILDLELDICKPHALAESDSFENSTKCNALHDFHVSCFIPKDSLAAKEMQSATAENIRTISAVVPVLQDGDCITVLASIFINNLNIKSQNFSNKSTMKICVQGNWFRGTPPNKIAGRNPVEKQPIRGAVLCLFRLPTDSIFLSPQRTCTPRHGQWIQHEIDFTNECSTETYNNEVPIAIFDHRNPRTLVIDTSNAIGTAKDTNTWKKLIDSLNERIPGDTHIEFYCVRGQPKLYLVIFGSNPEDRAGEL
mmetsp:Transcript_21539/g.44454  ORF Transcript_21539/g.44454 Transcript_21539/m.44454 type:complete len:708 (-) Transcript_21539:444-2567(-)